MLISYGKNGAVSIGHSQYRMLSAAAAKFMSGGACGDETRIISSNSRTFRNDGRRVCFENE